MITYIPFLKAKQGELTAMGDLAPEVKQHICPFFDFPRKSKYDATLFAAKAAKIATALKKHWGAEQEFYFDDLDVKENLTVKGRPHYAHVLEALRGLRVIPVVGLARSHNPAVAALKRNGEINSPVVAFRAHPTDFEDFDGQQSEIEYDLDDVFKEFEEIDLIFDCQVCSSLDASETGQQIAAFAQKFSSAYPKVFNPTGDTKVRRVIVTGSCIPAKIGDVLGTKDVTILPRRELEIISKARDLADEDILPGDYTIVSPHFSDKEFDPRILQKVTVPRLIYSFDHSHYISRGVSLESGGQDQYCAMIQDLCRQKFFRKEHSFGDAYFTKRSNRVDNKKASNASVVRPSVGAHITYMVTAKNP